MRSYRRTAISLLFTAVLTFVFSGSAHAETPRTMYKNFSQTGTFWVERNGIEACVQYEFSGTMGARVGWHWGHPYWEDAFVLNPNLRISLSQGNAAILEHGQSCTYTSLLPTYSKGIYMSDKLFGAKEDCEINTELGVSFPAAISFSFSQECNMNVNKWFVRKSATSKSSDFRLSVSGTTGTWRTHENIKYRGQQLCFQSEFYGVINRPDTDAYSAAFLKRAYICLPVADWAGVA